MRLACYITDPYHPHTLRHTNYFWLALCTMKLPYMQFPPATSHLPLTPCAISWYVPQYHSYSWWCKKKVLLKCRYPSTKLHGFTTLKPINLTLLNCSTLRLMSSNYLLDLYIQSWMQMGQWKRLITFPFRYNFKTRIHKWKCREHAGHLPAITTHNYRSTEFRHRRLWPPLSQCLRATSSGRQWDSTSQTPPQLLLEPGTFTTLTLQLFISQYPFHGSFISWSHSASPLRIDSPWPPLINAFENVNPKSAYMKDDSVDLSVDGRIILKRIKKMGMGEDWIHTVKDGNN
jgi:hypothetical protein